jgi:hypothetical protein
MPEVGIDTYYYYNKKYYGEKEKEKSSGLGIKEEGDSPDV